MVTRLARFCVGARSPRSLRLKWSLNLLYIIYPQTADVEVHLKNLLAQSWGPMLIPLSSGEICHHKRNCRAIRWLKIPYQGFFRGKW